MYFTVRPKKVSSQRRDNFWYLNNRRFEKRPGCSLVFDNIELNCYDCNKNGYSFVYVYVYCK